MVRANASAVKSEDDLAYNFPAPGKYLAVVKDGEELNDRVQVQFECLAGTVPGQTGKELRERFGKEEAHEKRITRLLMVTHLLNPGEDKDVDIKTAIGRPLVIEVVKSKDGKYHNLAYMGMWRTSHPDVADVMAIPDVKRAYDKLVEAYKAGKAGPNGNPAMAPAAAPVQQQPVAAAAGNPWENV